MILALIKTIGKIENVYFQQWIFKKSIFGLLSKVLFIGLAWMETDFLTVCRPQFWLIRGFSFTCPNLNVFPRCTHDIVCFICPIFLWLQQYLRHRLLRARSCLQLFTIFILQHEKFLLFDWFRAVVFQLNLKNYKPFVGSSTVEPRYFEVPREMEKSSK